MSNEPVERELTERVRVRLDAWAKANAAPRCGARSKRTSKPCRGAAMPNGRCKLHGGKSTGPRTPRANWKHGYYSGEAKAEQSRLRAAILALRETRWPMPATTPGRCRHGSATRTSSTRCDTPSWRRTGSRTSGDSVPSRRHRGRGRSRSAYPPVQNDSALRGILSLR
jgi:hypothetical protein